MMNCVLVLFGANNLLGELTMASDNRLRERMDRNGILVALWCYAALTATALMGQRKEDR